MEFSSIVIIGLGFMGGSLAMAIKKAGFKGIVVGVARNEDNLRRAKERGIIDEYKTSPQEGVGDSDLVILSTGIGSFKNILRSIRDRLKKGTIVSDIGSVKGELVEQMESMMPEGVSFVGAHPIAGSERKGVDEAFPELYRGCKCIITPTDKTDEDALRKIEDFWRFIGAEPVEMDCYEHDRIFAALSHFPHVLAYALV
ncbi:MAG: prephenate dehydrogenase/arogenate dehydrogenase family protein, partial [Nitrospirae bacterium]